jgi:hypothetical protein
MVLLGIGVVTIGASSSDATLPVDRLCGLVSQTAVRSVLVVQC